MSKILRNVKKKDTGVKFRVLFVFFMTNRVFLCSTLVYVFAFNN